MTEEETIGTTDEPGQESQTPVNRVIFRISGGAELYFDHQVRRDGTCIADNCPGIDLAEQAGIIEVIERDVKPGRDAFTGGPEPVLNGSLKYVEVGVDPLTSARTLEIKQFGEWKCQRCTHITYIPVENGKIAEPFECDNETCGRKGPFKKTFPVHLLKPIWKLPLEPVAAGNIEVYTDVYNFCKKYLVLEEEQYHIMTCWVLASWLVEDFTTCPYLCMIAPKSSGKTKVLEVLGELAYRSVSAISVTPPALFRAIELWHITLLIDEAEFQIRIDTEAGQALYGCLNGGYKKGSFALRTEGDAGNRIPAAFDVFGFKAISSTKLFHPTLESRSIIINMTQGVPEKILIDEGEAALLRAKLLYWRFATLGKLPLVIPESQSGRLIEMFIPLFTIAQILKGTEGIIKPISYKDLVKILQDLMCDMESARKDEEQQSPEAVLLGAISILQERCRQGYTDEPEYIFVKEIVGQLGWESKPAIIRTISSRLKAMGLRTGRKDRGTVLYIWDHETQERLKTLEMRFLTQNNPERQI